MTSRTRLVLWLTLVGFMIAVEYASPLAGGSPDREVVYRYSTAAGSAMVYGILLLMVLGISSGRRDLLALRRPISWAKATGFMAALLVGVYVAVTALDQLLHGGREQGLTPSGWEPRHAGAYAANFIVIAIVAPVVEELTFRGLGYSLLERFGVWRAIFAVGATFALAHGLFQAFPELFVFGCALAWLRAKTTSVYPGILLHSVFNAIALTLAVTVHH